MEKLFLATTKHEINVGTKIYFEREKRPYTVKAFDFRYVICTKPFPLKKTVLYTIIDWKEDIRGPIGLVFNIYDFEEKRKKDWEFSINRCIKDLQAGEVEISYRGRVPLDIVKVVTL